MRWSKAYIPTVKEDPADAAVRAQDGHWWHKVRLEGGSVGWVNVDYLQPIGGQGATL